LYCRPAAFRFFAAAVMPAEIPEAGARCENIENYSQDVLKETPDETAKSHFCFTDIVLKCQRQRNGYGFCCILIC
jgi:hypothetical protein